MISVRVMQMTIHEKVPVIAVGHGLVATAGAVHVGRIVCVTRMALGATIGIRP